jgi:hypothetical protein
LSVTKILTLLYWIGRSGAAVRDSKQLASSAFTSIPFIHANRACNIVVQIIAKSAIHDINILWVGEMPELFW